MHPFTLAVPKELAPLGNRPAIHLVLDEAAGAGIDEAIVVVAPDKELLRLYLERAQAEGSWPGLRLRFVLQPEPTGLADAIALCDGELEGAPFAVLLPDNLPLAPKYRLDPLLALWREHGRHGVAVIEVDRRWSGLYGNSGRIEYRAVAPGVIAIERLHDKEPGRLAVADGTRLLRACGRYVFGSEVFERLLEARRAAPTGELSEVPAVQRLALEGRLLGALVPQPLFDVGHPAGLLAASAYLAEGMLDSIPSAS